MATLKSAICDHSASNSTSFDICGDIALLNASKTGIQHSFEQIVDLLKKLNYKFDISEGMVRLF